MPDFEKEWGKLRGTLSVKEFAAFNGISSRITRDFGKDMYLKALDDLRANVGDVLVNLPQLDKAIRKLKEQS